MGNEKAASGQELWGYLLPALGLVAVGVFAVVNGGNGFAPAFILVGLVLAAYGLHKRRGD